MQNEERRIDISAKLMQMAQALIAEGNKNQDNNIRQSGNVLMALSGVLLSDEEMFLFSQFCLMFTAKKVLDQSKGFDDSEHVRKVMKNYGLLDAKKPRKPRGPNKKKSDE